MFKVGYARYDITPTLGLPIDGYYKDRFVEGILDPLEVCALAFEAEGKKAVILAIDNTGLGSTKFITSLREYVSEKCSIAMDAIYIHATHTHTSVGLGEEFTSEGAMAYKAQLKEKLVLATDAALSDLTPAKMGWGIGKAPNISFIRRFRMKDGSVATNPGINNPNIVAPICEIDDNVYVLRFDRENADTVVLVNFADHPDVVGGSKVSGDWPAATRRQVEISLPGVKSIVLNGCQGDINHVNVHPVGGFNNDLENDFDDVMRGYGHVRYMARVITGGVFQAYDKVNYVDVKDINFLTKTTMIPSNMPTKEEVEVAYKYEELHRAGKDAEIPFEGMMLTTVVAEAERMIRLENGPEAFALTMTGLKIGPVALVGIPGEPFNGIGKGIKAADDWDLVITSCITNGYEGYFPMKDAYDEGGYEARSSIFKAGVAELIIDEGKKLLGELK